MKTNFYPKFVKTVFPILVSGFLLAACVQIVVPSIDSTQIPSETLERLEESTPLPSNPIPTEEDTFPTFTRPMHLEVDEKLLEGIQITLMHPWQDSTSELLEMLVNEFNVSNQWGINVNLDAKRGSDDLLENLQDTLHSSEIPNIAVLYPHQAEQLNGNYLWMDLVPYIFDENWGLDPEILSDIPEGLLSSQMVGEKMLGFPALMSANVLFYNLTWANELGFETPPVTIQELREQSCAAYQALLEDNITENNGTGGMLLDFEPASALSWYHALGGVQLPQQGMLSFNNIQGQNAFASIKDLYDSGCAWVGRQSQPYDYFVKRMALFYTGASTDIAQQLLASSAMDSEDKWIMLPYPSIDGEGSLLFNNLSYIVTINKPEDQLASWLFIRFMVEKAAIMKISGVSTVFPLRMSVMKEIFAEPEWSYLGSVENNVYFIPNRNRWSVESMVLQDAFLRSLILEPSSMSVVLETLDMTLKELAEMSFDD